MTDTAKTTLWVIIILVLVGGIWWFIGSNPDAQIPPPPQPVEQVNDVQETTIVEAEPQDESTSISVQDKSDASLEADLSKVDDQLSALSADSAI
jgi:cytoskeletal protein RodZ